MMPFLDRRIQVICDELIKYTMKQRIAIKSWQMKEGFFVYPKDADNAPSPWENFDSATMHWYGPDKHYWFRTNITVPDSFAHKPLWLKIKNQVDEWDDSKNPQFLIFVDGVPYQGIDTNHREVLLTKNALAGQSFQIDLQAYTGTLHSEFRLLVEMRELDSELNGLYWDLQVPLQAFRRLEKESQARLKLEKVMNDTINLLDLRVPYSDNYMRSVKEARKYIQKHLYESLGGHDDVIASCIGHTHLDVAWWWTVKQTREKTARSFATVLRLMEEYPNYLFMSSQPQLYAFLKERYPELYDQVKKRVQEGRWEVEGSTWLEMDTNLTSGESLIRQFLYGKKFFQEEFDKDNRVLWLPDVFGYTGNLPQIMKICETDYFMTTKISWNQFNKFPYDTFVWRGIDGSEVLTHFISTPGVGQDETKSFYTTYNAQLHPDALMGAWNRYQNKDINNDVLISYGYGDGGGGPTRQMLETSDRMEHGIIGLPKVRQVFARTYFEELEERVKDNRRLPLWEGELYFEYHRGTLTSMGRNKRSNRKSEIGMMDLETLAVLAEEWLPYPKTEIEFLWKTILINQFHDILPGTSIHAVYETTKKEYAQVRKEGTQLINQRLKKLFPLDGGITVINTKGFNSNEIVHIRDFEGDGLLDEQGHVYPAQKTQEDAVVYLSDLPAKGWKTYEIINNVNADNPFTQGNQYHLETPFYIAEFSPGGNMSRLYDKRFQREVLKAGAVGNSFVMYEDKPMNYDNWDIDIYYTEKSWQVDKLTSFKWIEKGPVRYTLELSYEISQSAIRQQIHFYKDSPRIDFQTVIDWKEHQHLLKVHFPVNIHNDEATFDIQFGSIKRKVTKNTSWDVARFESCAQKWMDFSEGHYGISLLNDCKYGHSVDDGVIALTLIKSGIVPNPVSDQEVHRFTYALLPHTDSWQQGNTVYEGYQLNQPAWVVKGQTVKKEYSLLQVKAKNIIVETVKKAENGKGYIVRMYECENAQTNTIFTWNKAVHQAFECNGLEKNLQPIEVQNNQLKLFFRPFEIKTIRIVD